MQFYKAKLKINGSPFNEVRGIYSVPELIILWMLHGNGSISDIERTGASESLKEKGRRNYLKNRYDSSLVKKELSVDKIFGPLGNLPDEFPQEFCEGNNYIDRDIPVDAEDTIEAVKKVTQKDKKRYKKNYEAKTKEEQENLEKEVSPEEVDLDMLA